jgi:carboxymethylenebutenolidase
MLSPMTTTRMESCDAPGGDCFDTTIVVPDSGTGPGVLLFQEIFGVNDFLLGKAKELATLGYVVVCPDVFWRVERGVCLPHDDASLQEAFGLMGRYIGEVDDETKAADLVAALAHVRAQPEVAGNVAVMGYCLGGLLAYTVAALGDPDACVSYYGSAIASRLDVADQITCPIMFHFGSEDAFIPNEEVAAIRAAFAGRDNAEVHVHDGAGHAFENLLAPQFANADAAARSWPLTVDFLQRTLQP